MSTPTLIGTLTSGNTTVTPASPNLPAATVADKEVWIFAGAFSGATAKLQIGDNQGSWVDIETTLVTVPQSFRLDCVYGCPIRAICTGATGGTSIAVSRAQG